MDKIIIASGPVIIEDNKALLNQHGDTAFWKFCGGRVENFNTDLIDNARREAKEEMGVGLKILNNEPFISFARKSTPEGDIDVILAHFLAKCIGKIKPGSDIRKWAWLDIDELNKHDLGPNIMSALKYFGFLK